MLIWRNAITKEKNYCINTYVEHSEYYPPKGLNRNLQNWKIIFRISDDLNVIRFNEHFFDEREYKSDQNYEDIEKILSQVQHVQRREKI
jgi:hypothetical protein